ncbi:MAG: HDIG domain-containing protein [Candidatus Aminicenantes bacterium]|nr:HDIG domain-containing protein [Candidatus Aminicenantes bacterium]
MKYKLNFFKDYNSHNGKIKKRPSSLKILFAIIFILAISYILYIPLDKPIVTDTLKTGDIVKKDIIITKDITLEDKENTDKTRKAAIENVVPVYEYHSENQGKTKNLINEWYHFLRQSRKTYIKNRKELQKIKETIEKNFGIGLTEKTLKYILLSNVFNKVNSNRLFEFIKPFEKKGILASKAGAKKSKAGTIKVVSKIKDPQILKVDKIYDLREIEVSLKKFLKSEKIGKEDIDIIVSIFMEFMDVNLAYSITLTREEENLAASQINPVIIKLKAGKIILRKGDEIKPDDIKIIKLIAAEQKTREKTISTFYLILAIMAFLLIFTARFFSLWKSTDLNRKKLFVVTSATLFVSVAIYRISIFLFPIILKNISVEINYQISSIYFAIPFAFGALIIAFTFNLQSAVIYSFLNAILSGIICDWNFKIVIYVLVGNLAASYAIEFYARIKRSAILKASLFWLLPFNIVCILLFNLTDPDIDISLMLFNVFFVGFSAVLSPLLANFIIPLWEIIFNLINDLKLIELNNLNLPIFREMLEKAPGTYHHSQMVASLSETAALDLNLSPYLITAMALYHDIGKIENPQFFTENNTVYPDNTHDKLNPQESAKMIIAHISDGMDMAKELKLPQVVACSINQHHGTKLVRFFYDQALEQLDVETDDLDEKTFRYPGEKPQNIENAIIMLADQVEAASKSLSKPTDEEIRNIIQKIIDSDIEEKQFDECDGLTFKSLNIIANGFLRKLSSIYHMRISYPGFDFKEKNDKPDQK